MHLQRQNLPHQLDGDKCCTRDFRPFLVMYRKLTMRFFRFWFFGVMANCRGKGIKSQNTTYVRHKPIQSDCKGMTAETFPGQTLKTFLCSPPARPLHTRALCGPVCDQLYILPGKRLLHLFGDASAFFSSGFPVSFWSTRSSMMPLTSRPTISMLSPCVLLFLRDSEFPSPLMETDV